MALPIYPAIMVGGRGVEPFSTLPQSVTNLVETLGKKRHLMSMFLFVLIKKGEKYRSMVPPPLLPIQCCIASLKVCGHSNTAQECQEGRGGGGYLYWGPKNTLC